MLPLRSAEHDLRIVAQGIDHPECVAWFEDRLYCGTESGSLLQISPNTGAIATVADTAGFILGITFASDGTCIVCDSGRHEVLQLDLDGQITTLAQEADGRRLSMPNYPLMLPAGELLVSDSGARWGSDNGFLFTVNLRTRAVSVVAEDCSRFPNGLVLAPDHRSVFLVESRLPGVVKYDLIGATLSRRRVVVEMPGTVPDGLAFDAAGNLYISCWRPDRVYRLAPDGKLEIFLDDFTAEYLNSPTNICFGGAEFRTLFIAGLCGWAVTAIDVDVPGLPNGAVKRRSSVSAPILRDPQ